MENLSFFTHTLSLEINQTFSGLCAELEPGLLQELISAIDDYVKKVHGAIVENEFLDIETAERIAKTLTLLLQKIESIPQSKQRLVVGAARYFIRTHDAQDDFFSLLGFDDDVAVLNYVLVELGQSEKRISL